MNPINATLDRPADPLPASRPDTLDKSVLLLTLCVWAGYFVLTNSLTFLVPGRGVDAGTLASRAVIAVVGIALCLGMYVLLRRFGGARPWALLAKAASLSVVPAALLVFTGMYAFRSLSSYYEARPEEWMDPFLMGWNLLSHLWMLFTWSALYVGAVAILEIRRRDVQLVAARSAAQQAQLLALRLQINPHFLFNTLNTLAAFIVLGRREDSEQIVLNLSQFLRQTLSRTQSELVPLEDEVEMLRRYLDIETARFPDRLQVRYEVAPGCARARVPALVLLPLAENSVKYALAGSESGIAIVVGARREDDQLVLWLEDAGAPGSGGKGLGIGLSNLGQQLAALFGEDASLQAGPTSRGWRNVVRLPWREVDA
ncbi:histidine kinase [Luteimonas sp. SJ-92]|uniref:Histidine kinase n=1 Tax=Luteimonas salinisoli TaxID=2752307 RepID=A0A853J7D0_9GAMM|nr:histidine kinase [Luteimonas salinisoli]NZA24785.1 histidine kinase [Luteimonas salinisoli]